MKNPTKHFSPENPISDFSIYGLNAEEIFQLSRKTISPGPVRAKLIASPNPDDLRAGPKEIILEISPQIAKAIELAINAAPSISAAKKLNL